MVSLHILKLSDLTTFGTAFASFKRFWYDKW